MSGTFSGLEMARRAMDYFRQGIETAGHNMSNADVEGYSRQTVQASPTPPYTEPGLASPATPGQIGTGVAIDAIVRMQDEFLNTQFRQESIEGGYWEALSQTMDYLEMFVGEPSSGSLSDTMNAFWDSMQEFQKNPDSTAARQNFLQQTDNMITQIAQIERNFEEYRTDLNQEVELQVDKANDILDQIASLNTRITKVEYLGNNPNDLLDERDMLVEDLSRLLDVDVSVPTDPYDGHFRVDLGGIRLIQGDQVSHLVVVAEDGNGGFFDVQVEGQTFEAVTNPEILGAAIGREAEETIHSVDVKRLATETRWAIGDTETTSETTTEALGLEGSFTLSVGSLGVKSTSDEFETDILLDGEPAPGEPTTYSFRIASGKGENSETVVTIQWDDTNGCWTDASGNSISGAPTDADKDKFSLNEFRAHLEDQLTGVTASVDDDRLTLTSDDNHLISVTDLSGNLANRLGFTTSDPVVTIEVDQDDSLRTIANKINNAYGSGDGAPDCPDEWLHASVEETEDGTFYLKIESNQVGEEYRINVGTTDGGSSFVAEQLGLAGTDGTTQVLEYALDAMINVDGKKYLSSTNAFSEARQITSTDGYRAETSTEVLKSIRLNVKAVGNTNIRVERQVEGGYIAGLMTSRDDVIPELTATLDTFARVFAEEMNAIHYSGYGTGDSQEITGTAFFNPLTGVTGAASSLAINDELLQDISLMAGAGGDGTGHSNGIGDGSNAVRLIGVRSARIYENSSATMEDFYSSFIAELGSRSSQARVMEDNQETLLSQISNQRQTISGVNIDEEMMDLITYQQSYSAIARYVTVLDEMMNTIINGMGIVGR